MKRLVAAVIIAYAGGCVAALAVQHSVMQKGRVFSESALTIKKGDTILFVNDDNISHNILSTSPGNEFNLGSQPPGASAPVTFEKTGEASVMCAIHPRMKLSVTITD